MSAPTMSRRELLRRAGGLAALGAGGALLAACGSSATTTTAKTSTATAATTSSGASKAGGGPVKGGTLSVAQTGDPPTLDVHTTTADVTASDTQDLFEGLFALDAQGKPQPMLATGSEWTNSNLTLVIHLRKDVLFHDGTPMTATDAAASIKRWLKLSALGQTTAASVKDVVAKGASTVAIDLSGPVGLLPTYLANPNNMAAIMPKSLMDKYGDKPIPKPIGTGPYKLEEWKPDAYIKLTRWDKYRAVSQPASGYAGHKAAYLDEIDILPVPDTNTRLAGLESGEYQVVPEMDTDQYSQLTGNPAFAAVIVKPNAWYIFDPNKTKGLMSDISLRQAFIKALSNKPIMQAAFGPQAFWSIASPTIGYLAYTDDSDGTGVFNHQDIAGAKALLKQAKYDGTPLRFMTTKNYAWMYNGAVVAKSQLETVGFKVDLQVYDWATVVHRRSNPDLYDVFTTGIGGIPAIPTAMDAFVSPKWPGFWNDPKMLAAVKQFAASVDLSLRQKAWDEVQKLFYADVAAVKVGDYFGLDGRSTKVNGMQAVAYTPYANVWLTKA